MPANKARICRRAGALFLAAALYWTMGLLLAISAPGLRVNCDLPKPCVTTADALLVLSEEQRTAIAGDPQLRARAEARSAMPGVRIGLGALALLETGPIVVVLLSVGLALRRLGSRGDHVLIQTIPWLKHASRAALVWAVVSVFVQGMRSALLVPGSADIQVSVDLTQAPLPVLLSVAAYAIAWALEAGIYAERDLANFV